MMNNGAENNPSAMNWRKLLAQKAYLGLNNAQIAEAARVSERTVRAFLNGDERVRPETQDAIARALGLRRRVDFELIETDGISPLWRCDLTGANNGAAAPESTVAPS